MSQSRFLTEDIVINILLRLPVASCIFRFRCVCKSWRILLSDPIFIRKIIFFQTPADQQSLRLLIAGGEDAVRVRRICYSLHSYDTLCPISVAAADLPSVPYKMRQPWSTFRVDIAGCCDGIFCISDKNHDGASDIILWNPTTLETKFLPLSPCPHPPKLHVCCGFIGFGFDPLTHDYKVVRTLKFREIEYFGDHDDDDDPDELDCPPPFIYKEVYSLRNDSWKRLNDDFDLTSYGIRYVHHDNTFRREKCYWSYTPNDGNFGIISFDMGKKVFEIMVVAIPFDISGSYWSFGSCFQIKESFVTTFELIDFEDISQFQIWGLMKYGARDSWTKLFVFEVPIWALNDNLEVWRDGTYISSRKTGIKDSHRKLFTFDPTAGGEVIDNDCLDIQGRVDPLRVHTYTPTLAPLSY